jgi:hypothetical protein
MRLMAIWKKRWWSVVLLLIVMLAGGLRVWKYWEFPVVGETQDEVFWTMLGRSLIQTGQPHGWSYFSSYQQKETVLNGGVRMTLVTPSLDHPPLFSFLPGTAQTLMGKSWRELPSSKVMRLPLVGLGILNVGLFVWWLRRLKVSGIWLLTSSLIFATAPTFVLLSRLVVAENLLVTWIILWLITATTNSPRLKWLRYLALVAAPITKISGVALNAAAIATDIGQRRWSQLRQDALATVGGIGLLLLYAARFDLGLFLRIQAEQSQRDVGLLTFFTTQLWSPTLVERLFGDVWVTMGWLVLIGFIGSATVWLPTLKKNLAERGQTAATDWMPTVVLLAVAQLAFILLSVGEHTIHGWYRIVFFPLFAFLFGWAIDAAWRKRNWLIATLVILLIVLPETRLALIYVWGFASFTWWPILLKLGGLIAAGMTGLAVLPMAAHWQRRWAYGVVVAIMAVVVICHVAVILTIQPVRYWQDAFYLETGLRP